MWVFLFQVTASSSVGEFICHLGSFWLSLTNWGSVFAVAALSSHSLLLCSPQIKTAICAHWSIKSPPCCLTLRPTDGNRCGHCHRRHHHRQHYFLSIHLLCLCPPIDSSPPTAQKKKESDPIAVCSVSLALTLLRSSPVRHIGIRRRGSSSPACRSQTRLGTNGSTTIRRGHYYCHYYHFTISPHIRRTHLNWEECSLQPPLALHLHYHHCRVTG